MNGTLCRLDVEHLHFLAAQLTSLLASAGVNPPPSGGDAVDPQTASVAWEEQWTEAWTAYLKNQNQ